MAGRLRDLTLRQLKAVAAVAAQGSVTGAARALHLTQPAITLQLRNVQGMTELPLIQRTGDGMILTDAGRELLRLHDRIEAAIMDCQDTLDVIAGRSGGRVSIAAVSTAKYFVPGIIAAFSRHRPNVKVSLAIGNRAAIMEAMRHFDLDFAVMGRPPADVAVEKHRIGEHPHVIIASTDHPFACRPGLAIGDLADATFLTREVGSGTRMLMERFFEAHRFVPTIGAEFDSNETIKQGVIAGLGVAFISAHTVARELSDRRLVTLAIAGLPVTREWFIIRRSDKLLLPPAQDAFDFVVAAAPRFLPSL